jgi:predicted phosphodiesterase
VVWILGGGRAGYGPVADSAAVESEGTALRVTRKPSWWSGIAVLALVLAWAGTSAHAVTIVKGPYLQHVTETSIVVMWETDVATTGTVECGPGAGAYRVAPTDDRTAPIHEVRISDLTPNSLYHYRVSSGDAVGPDATFRTAPPPGVPFRFAAYGDNRSDPGAHRKVVNRMIADRPRLIIHTGDLVGDGNHYELWKKEFFDPAEPLISRVPVATCLGNHENNSHWYYDFFSNPADSGSEAWYAFRFGDARFICLDSMRDFGPGSAQRQWLDAVLAKPTDAVWTIAFFHYPPYASGGHKGNTKVQEQLVPLFEQHHVDLVVNGHCHNYERSVHNGVVYVTTGGGGAPLAGVHDYPNPYQVHAESVYHHCIVDVTSTTLTCRGVRADSGKTFDQFTLRHATPAPARREP